VNIKEGKVSSIIKCHGENNLVFKFAQKWKVNQLQGLTIAAKQVLITLLAQIVKSQ
jgi:hypothetical protein